MSFWSALFGRREAAATAKVSDPVEYKGFVIRAAPYKNNGGYQTAGTIERESAACASSTASFAPTRMRPMTTRYRSRSTRRGRSSICRASGFSTSERAHHYPHPFDDAQIALARHCRAL